MNRHKVAEKMHAIRVGLHAFTLMIESDFELYQTFCRATNDDTCVKLADQLAGRISVACNKVNQMMQWIGDEQNASEPCDDVVEATTHAFEQMALHASPVAGSNPARSIEP